MAGRAIDDPPDVSTLGHPEDEDFGSREVAELVLEGVNDTFNPLVVDSS